MLRYAIGGDIPRGEPCRLFVRCLALATECALVGALVAAREYFVYCLLAEFIVRGSDLLLHVRAQEAPLRREREAFYRRDLRAQFIHELEEDLDEYVRRFTQESERLRNVWTSRLDDPYAVLGVARGARAEQVKRAYRRMALKYHPDKAKAYHMLTGQAR